MSGAKNKWKVWYDEAENMAKDFEIAIASLAVSKNHSDSDITCRSQRTKENIQQAGTVG